MQSENYKRMKMEKQYIPKVFKGALSSSRCSTWNLEDWANACGDTVVKFRSASRDINTHPRWENDATFFSATIQQLSDIISEKDGVSNSALSTHNPFQNVDFNSEWVYTSYNYMSDIFCDKPEMYGIIDWSVFGLESRNAKDSTLWIGTAGSHTPCHQDSYGENLVAQMCGRKLWVLFPPEETCNLYPTRIPYEESSVFSSVSILNPDFDRFPKFRDAKVFAVVLEAGDVLFVPPKWWHYVHCLDTAVSVNIWIETEKDDLHRLEEAVVRMLMTALIPVYQPEEESWLNQNEELMTPNKTTEIFSAVLHEVTKELRHDLLVVDLSKPSVCQLVSHAVPEVSHAHLKNLLVTLSVLPFIKENPVINKSGNCSGKENSERDILKNVFNRLLYPTVIESIVKELTNK